MSTAKLVCASFAWKKKDIIKSLFVLSVASGNAITIYGKRTFVFAVILQAKLWKLHVLDHRAPF